MSDTPALVSTTSVESYFVFLAADGTVNHFDKTSTGVPVGATVVSADQYDTIAASHDDGQQCAIISGVVRIRRLPTAPPPTPDISGIKDAAYAHIDLDAETARLLFITNGSGQALEYQATADECAKALALLATTPPTDLNPADYPWIVAEQDALAVKGTTVSLPDTVKLVAQTISGWVSAGTTIKRIRREAKLRVDMATTSDEVSNILSAIQWPKP